MSVVVFRSTALSAKSNYLRVLDLRRNRDDPSRLIKLWRRIPIYLLGNECRRLADEDQYLEKGSWIRGPND